MPQFSRRRGRPCRSQDLEPAGALGQAVVLFRIGTQENVHLGTGLVKGNRMGAGGSWLRGEHFAGEVQQRLLEVGKGETFRRCTALPPGGTDNANGRRWSRFGTPARSDDADGRLLPHIIKACTGEVWVRRSRFSAVLPGRMYPACREPGGLPAYSWR